MSVRSAKLLSRTRESHFVQKWDGTLSAIQVELNCDLQNRGRLNTSLRTSE